MRKAPKDEPVAFPPNAPAGTEISVGNSTFICRGDGRWAEYANNLGSGTDEMLRSLQRFAETKDAFPLAHPYSTPSGLPTLVFTERGWEIKPDEPEEIGFGPYEPQS